MPSVQVLYYTDPAGPWSWALEPALRRLIRELEQSLRVAYVMCAVAREFGAPAELSRQALDAAAGGAMPERAGSGPRWKLA